MKWRKLGLVYRPEQRLPWAASHAMIPTPLEVTEKAITLLVSRCDSNGVGSISMVRIDPEATPGRTILGESDVPLLQAGQRGCFDDNGVVACSAVHLEDNRYVVYYVGFEKCIHIRYRLLTGACTWSTDESIMTRTSTTPLLERIDGEEYFRCGPCVVVDHSRYRMWYVAGNRWTTVDGIEKPVYDIRYLESNDPLKWQGAGRCCLGLGDDEHGFGRPWVLFRNGQYEMFYSRRSLRNEGQYRLGYAISSDGLTWERRDGQLNLDVSPSGFDSDGIMYSAVLSFRNRIYCFYNGNGFGRDGVGAAVLEEE